MFHLHKLNIFHRVLLILLILDVTLMWAEIIESSCFNQLACKAFENSDTRANCTDGFCVCTTLEGAHVQCKPQDVKLSNIIGGHCPCSLPNTECNKTQNLCFCMDGYTPSANGRECLKDQLSLGSKCEKDFQCQTINPYAICSQEEHACKCGESFLLNPNSKFPQCVSAALNISCTIDAECEHMHPIAFCIEGHERCACPFTHVVGANETTCRMTKGYQQTCSETLQCTKQLGPGGVCKDELCECDTENYYPMELETGTVCKRNGRFGGDCKDDTDCYQNNLTESEQTLVCAYRMCNCKDGYNYIENTCNGAFSLNVDRLMAAVSFAVVTLAISMFV